MHVSKKEIEVRYAETDQMGIVYHANYLVWMEVGRTALIKDLGFYTVIWKRKAFCLQSLISIFPIKAASLRRNRGCAYMDRGIQRL